MALVFASPPPWSKWGHKVDFLVFSSVHTNIFSKILLNFITLFFLDSLDVVIWLVALSCFSLTLYE